MDDDGGIEIVDVIAETGAKRAGIRIGDVLAKFNGDPVANPVELGALISRLEAGQKVTLLIQRIGEDEPLEVEVELGSAPPPKGKSKPLEPPPIR